MNVNTRGALAALAAMVVLAPPVSAQGTIGKGAIGGILGVPFFLADEDTKNGQSPRVLGQAQFQYVFNRNTRLALSGGYGWIGYKSGTPSPYPLYHPGLNDSVDVMDDALTKFQPLSATLLRSFKAQGKGWVPYVGAGVNLTRIEIVNDRRKIKDPATFDSYVNWAPGVQAQAGLEYFVGDKGNVAFDWHGRFAKLFSKDAEQFPSGFTGPHTYFTVNFGVNVYFWPIGQKPVETAPQPVEEAPAPLAPAEPAPEPTPTPAPVDTLTPPPSPAPQDTAGTDTTRTPGSSMLHHRATKATAPSVTAASSSTAAPAPAKAAPPLGIARERAEDGAICPAPSGSEATSGMFGVPGVPVVPPKAEDAPPPADTGPGVDDRSPEGGATP